MTNPWLILGLSVLLLVFIVMLFVEWRESAVTWSSEGPAELKTPN